MSKPRHSQTTPVFLAGEQRLNKVLAASGLGSRRQVEELIEQGRVEVDGKTCTEFHRRVDVTVNKISVDGQSLRKQRPVYYALNKPAGVLCTNRDPEGRTRVIDLIPGTSRVFPVGRLDRSSVGLILLTNDGELAQRLAHPRYSVPKTYFVTVQGQIENDQLVRLRRGIYLAEGVARVEGAKIRKVRAGCTELEITLTEGKNREIRRVLARLGHKVLILRRLAIGPLKLGDIPDGMHRPLTTSEVAALYQASEEARKAKNKPKTSQEKGKPPTKKSVSQSKSAMINPSETPQRDKNANRPKRSKSVDHEAQAVAIPRLNHRREHEDDQSEDSVMPALGMVEVSPFNRDAEDELERPQGAVIDYEDDESELPKERNSADGLSLDDLLSDEELDEFGDDDDESMPSRTRSHAMKKTPRSSDVPRLPGKRKSRNPIPREEKPHSKRSRSEKPATQRSGAHKRSGDDQPYKKSSTKKRPSRVGTRNQIGKSVAAKKKPMRGSRPFVKAGPKKSSKSSRPRQNIKSTRSGVKPKRNSGKR